MGGFPHFCKFSRNNRNKGLTQSVCIGETRMWQVKIRAFEMVENMLKKVTREIRAAVMLIVTEDITALRSVARNATNLVSKSIGKHQSTSCQDKKKP